MSGKEVKEWFVDTVFGKLAGHGKSCHLPMGPSPTQTITIESVRAVVNYMAWDSFLFMGHSIGGMAGVTWGSPSQPPVLVVHGKLDVCTGFRPLVKLLPPSFYYVAVDLPGNGRSDHLPRGVRYTVFDLVPTVEVVKKKFGWDKFIYMGHSLGALIGKIYNIVHPNVITRVVELDPVPAHHSWDTTREAMRAWYHTFYGSYEETKYKKIHGLPETAPKYTYEKAQELMMKSRKMTKEASEQVLERCLEPVGDGLYRFTYDQRMKEVAVLPFSGELLKKIYTTTTTPTLAILAQAEIDLKAYENCEFTWDLGSWPNKNYSFKIVDGHHDVHVYNPQCLADDVARFLLEHLKAKL
ncbi:serine hydrolase-like protein 2 isoform X2 [Ostrinia furnacalis]|uniref:serine hydrolase-like protein 2 isoform X2 n=1 Tax=Ostrinia furnacalis TaxID=93504 RepID=UPI00103F3935|nr:serine hydrolase-like protein 2 isoform X2 [Ostrinia furnacalis]